MSINQNGISFDKQGNVRANEFHILGSKVNKLVYNYTKWDVKSPANTVALYGTQSSGGERYLGLDPWGREIVLWGAESTGVSTSGYGIYGTSTDINNTKLYRFSSWERRITNNGETKTHQYYAGLNAYGPGTTNGACTYLTRSNLETNPYFWSAACNALGVDEGEWFLIIAHVWPHNHTGTTNHPDSGRYRLDGTKIGNITRDYKWTADTIKARPRTLALYTPSGIGLKHETCYMTFEEIDDNSPSLSDLIQGYSSRNFDYINSADGIDRAIDIRRDITYIVDIDEFTGTANSEAQQELTKEGVLIINGEFMEVD